MEEEEETPEEILSVAALRHRIAHVAIGKWVLFLHAALLHAGIPSETGARKKMAPLPGEGGEEGVQLMSQTSLSLGALCTSSWGSGHTCRVRESYLI